MSSVAPLLIATLAYLEATFLQKAYPIAVDEVYQARLEVAASRDPCPVPKPGRLCEWRISAREAGVWSECNGTEAPSGAQLASHRWFRITPRCYMHKGMRLWIPPQEVYR